MDPFRRYLDEILRLRPAGRPPGNVVALSRVDSTNRLARSIVEEYEAQEEPVPSILVLALEQSGGRGRLGRSWASPAGKGVYASRVVTVPDPALLQTLPLLVGVGLCRALDPFLPAPTPCRLKWPNDLLVDVEGRGRKIGGILIEALVHPGASSLAIIGFGVNHGHEADDLPEAGVSVLQLQAGPGVGLAELTWELVEGVERELEHLGEVDYAVTAYRERSVHRPGERIACRVADGVAEGSFVAIDDLGRLVLDNGGQELRLSSGEVI